MCTLFHEYSESQDWIVLGNDITLSHIKQIHGLEEIPTGLDGRTVLQLELPPIPINAGGIKVGAREFYLCYSPRHSFLFVVETEMGKRVETSYRPQYGANQNYDTNEIVQRIVWLYGIDSPRAKDPVIAQHLRAYLPNQK